VPGGGGKLGGGRMTTYIHPTDPDITITTDDDAHINDDGESYKAYGVGSDGNRYEITWYTTDAWDAANKRYRALRRSYDDMWATGDRATAEAILDELEDIEASQSDQSNACDWDRYYVRVVG
jgi:hypothetical protein